MGTEKRVTVDGKDYVIRSVGGKAALEAQKVYIKAFKDAVEDGAILKSSLEDHMRRQGHWDDAMQEKYENLLKRSAEIEYKIKSGVYKKSSELREKALELKRVRFELSELLMNRNRMDSLTADGLADQAKFEYLLTASVFDFDTNKPVFSSIEDYKSRETDTLTIKLATEYANFAYGLDTDFSSNLIENRLLKRLGLMDESGNLVNKQGRRVDIDGNLIDENGARIDENNNRIDINNNPVIDDSVIDTLEFEDDLSTQESPIKEEVVKTRRASKKLE